MDSIDEPDGLDTSLEINDINLYRPLPKTTYTRLLKLHSESTSIMIEADLFPFDLSSDDCPSYFALSYMWGTDEATDTIKCGGQLIKIRKNLFSVLTRIRATLPEVKSLYLWVDALCIDQRQLPHSISERSHQVQMMRLIYRSATEVFVDLGPGPDYFQPFSRIMDIVKAYEFDTGTDQSVPVEVIELAVQSCDAVEAGITFIQLIDNAYWTRVWVVQENIVPISRRFFLGDHSVDGIVFDKVMAVGRYFVLNQMNNITELLTENGLDTDSMTRPLSTLVAVMSRNTYINGFNCFRAISGWRNIYQTNRPQRGFDFFALIDNLRQFEATDDRDKVFALYGLANTDNVPAELRPNYDLSEDEVALSLSRSLIQRGKVESLFGYQRSKDLTFASWAVGLKSMGSPVRMIQAITIRNFNACGSHTSSISKLSSDNIVSLKGAVIDHIEAIHDVLPHVVPKDTGEIPDYSVAQMREMYMWMQKNRLWAPEEFPTKSAEVVDEMIARTCIADHFIRISYTNDEKNVGQTLENIKPGRAGSHIMTDFWEWLSAGHRLFDAESASELGDQEKLELSKRFWNTYGTHIHTTSRDRRLGITTGKHLALLPNDCEVGDSVCIFAGLRLPYVLRKRGATYQCVGYAYVHGSSDGEATEQPGWELEYINLS